MKVIEKFEESINDKNLFKAIFLAGGPGSGKSFVADNMFLSSSGISPLGVKVLNSDYFFELGLEKANLSKVINVDDEEVYMKQMAIRKDSKTKMKIKQGFYIDGMLPIIIDGTGKDFDKISRQAQELYNIGYDIAMVFINTSLDVALERNNQRERKVDTNLVVKMWTQVQKNIGKFQSYFGSKNFIIIDNNTYFEPGSRESKNFLDELYKIGRKLIEAPLENYFGKQVLTFLRLMGGKYLSDLIVEGIKTDDSKLEKSFEKIKERIIIRKIEDLEYETITLEEDIEFPLEGEEVVYLKKGSEIQIISEGVKVIDRIAKDMKRAGEQQRKDGGKIKIDYRHETVAIKLANGDEFFFQNNEAIDLLDEVPDNVNEEDYLFWIARSW